MDISTYSKKNTRWVYIGVSAIIIYIWHGYQFGRNDQIEWLPYALHMAYPELFNSDLYIQHVANQWPNERWFLAKIFSFIVPFESYLVFFAHLISLLLLCYSYFKIASKYINNNLLAILGLLFLIIPLSKFNLGGNEIYYNYMVSSVPAKAIGALSILLALEQRWILVSIALVMITFFQTLVGVQLFVLIFGAGLFCNLIQGKPVKNIVISIVIYGALVGWWIVNLLNATDNIGSVGLYSLFSFRIPHHFIPRTFGIWNYILSGIMLACSILWLWKKKIFFPLIFILLITLGCGVYALCVGMYQNELVLKTQWFKTTIWIELWFSISMISFIYDFSNSFNISKYLKFSILSLPVIVLISLVFRNPVYQFPISYTEDSEIEIAKLVKENILDPEAIFIVPFENTTFKYWSRKGTYVDFKSVLHSPAYLNLWFDRIETLYGLNINSSFSTKGKSEIAKKHFLLLDEQDFSQTKADYLLTYKDHILNLDIVVQNDRWVVYQIQAP